jgi:hypothetical protein
LKLFNFLRKKTESTHPLGNDDGVQEVIDGLPIGNPGLRLEEIGDWIAVSERTGLDLETRARAYARLDEAGREAVSDLFFNLLSAPPDSPAVEQCWAPLTRYTRNAMRSYCDLLRDNEGQVESSLSAEVISRSIFRGLHAAMCLKKLLHMKIQIVPPELMAEIYWLFLMAEKNQITRNPLKMYPGKAEPTTIQQEFVAGIAFEMGPWQNLKLAQMELLDLLVRKFSANFSFRGIAERNASYAVDLASRFGPIRLHADKPQTASMRYIGTGIVLGHIAQLFKQLQSNGAIPDWFSLPGAHPKREYVAMLKKLQLCWSDDSADRRQPRERQEMQIDALHGFREIRRMVASIEYIQSGRTTAYRVERPDAEQEPAVPLDSQQRLKQMELAGDRQLMQQWTLIDRSKTGIGAVANRHYEWLKVGALIGFRKTSSMQWSIGVARRLSRNARGQIIVGMQLFEGELAVTRAGALDKLVSLLFEDPTMVSEGPIFSWHDAVVMRGTTTILMQNGRYAEGARYLLNIGAEKKYVRLTTLLEEGNDYCLSHYEEYEPE